MRPVNVVFGEMGVGKSSVINLIAGRPVANVSTNPQGCTMSSTQYSFDVGGRQFRIWDTVGLANPEMGTNSYLAAVESAVELIQQLSQEGGLDLLLFCILGGRLSATTQRNYRLFYEVLCGCAVPISLVVTHLENETAMEDWYSRHYDDLEKYGIKSTGYACVTGLPGHSKSEESKVAIEKLLLAYDSEGKYSMPHDAWFVEFLRLFGMFSPPKDLKGKKLVDTLIKRCGMNPDVAGDSDIHDRLDSSLVT
ncbi:P-loop containing nucleoside triphosphate hydrolase protein [Melanogaster broomeanus]|nr:P-loop containing nucleoside triphosphate hydrolase protein [Melanogaster broomeanus]